MNLFPAASSGVSGYQDFAAAQQAIELGAQAYMLKPVNRDNLRNILLSAGSARQSSINAEQEKQRLGSRLKKLDDIEREAFINNLLFSSANSSQSEIITEAHRLGIALTTGKYAVMTINFRVQPAMNDEDFFLMLGGYCIVHNALPPVRDRLGQAAVLFNFPDFLNEEQIMEHLETAGESMLSEFSIAGVNGAFYDGAADAYSQHHPESIKMAMTVVATVPIICVYPFLQKYFVKGMMIGAVKG